MRDPRVFAVRWIAAPIRSVPAAAVAAAYATRGHLACDHRTGTCRVLDRKG